VEEVIDEPLYRDRVCGMISARPGWWRRSVPSEGIRAADARDPQLVPPSLGGRCWRWRTGCIRQVPAVVMEATGDTGRARSTGWRSRGWSACWPRRQVKPARPPQARPGRFRWLAACFERGAVTAPVATPSSASSGCTPATGGPTANAPGKSSAEKVAGISGVKISVLTDLHGVTGRDIMDHLIAGNQPQGAGPVARAAPRRKDQPAGRTLKARSSSPGARRPPKVAGLHRPVTADTGQRTAVIERLLAPYEEQLAQAESMPGWGRRAARTPRPRPASTWQVPQRRAPTPSWVTPAPRWTPVRCARRTRYSQKGNRPGRRHRQTAVAFAAPKPAKAPATGWPRRAARPKHASPPEPQLSPAQAAVQPRQRYHDLGPDYYERQRDIHRQIAHHVGKLGSPASKPPRRTPEPDPDTTGQTCRLTPTLPAGPDRPSRARSAAARPANLHFSSSVESSERDTLNAPGEPTAGLGWQLRSSTCLSNTEPHVTTSIARAFDPLLLKFDFARL
jgi:hypothetical protein